MQEQTLLVVACSALDTESMGAASAEKASSALAELDITNEKRHEPFPLTPAPSGETEDIYHLSPLINSHYQTGQKCSRMHRFPTATDRISSMI